MTYACVVALVRFPPLAEQREFLVLEQMFHIVFGIGGQQNTKVLFQWWSAQEREDHKPVQRVQWLTTVKTLEYFICICLFTFFSCINGVVANNIHWCTSKIRTATRFKNRFFKRKELTNYFQKYSHLLYIRMMVLNA